MKLIWAPILAAGLAAVLFAVVAPAASAGPDKCLRARPMQASEYNERYLPFSVPDTCYDYQTGTMGTYVLYYGSAPFVGTHEFCAHVTAEESSDYKNSTCTEAHEGTGEYVEVENDEWLVSGSSVTSSLATQFSGTIEFTDLKVPLFGETTVSCELILDGNVNSAGEGQITEVLNLKGENKAIVCRGVKGACGTSAEAAEVTFGHLPWATAIGLEGETIYYGYGGETEGEEPNFKAKCKSGGLEDLCEGHVTGVLTNGVSEALIKFSLVEQEEHEATRKDLQTCTQGGAEAGHINGEGKLATTAAEAIAVS